MDPKLIEKVCALGDRTRNEMMEKDEVLQQDNKDADELEQKYEMLLLDVAHKQIVHDYIACLESGWGRTADLAYLAGIKDTLSLFMDFDLLNKEMK